MSLQPRIDSRAFRQIVTIEVQDQGQDDEGQQNLVWRRLGPDIRADVHSINGREFIAAQANQAEATHMVESHWQPMFDAWQTVAAMRAKCGTRVFDIKTCDNVDQMNRLCRMMAKEGLKQR